MIATENKVISIGTKGRGGGRAYEINREGRDESENQELLESKTTVDA